jgi:pilus assembly protein FimV
MKKLFLNTLLFAALIGAQTSFAQERKAVEEKPAPVGGRTPAATQAAPATNSKGQENRATPATPATPATKGSETRGATPATPAQPANRSTETKSAQPAEPANKSLQPAKNVKKAEAQPAPGQSRISVNEGGLPATKTEGKKAD